MIKYINKKGIIDKKYINIYQIIRGFGSTVSCRALQ